MILPLTPTEQAFNRAHNINFPALFPGLGSGRIPAPGSFAASANSQTATFSV